MVLEEREVAVEVEVLEERLDLEDVWDLMDRWEEREGEMDADVVEVVAKAMMEEFVAWRSLGAQPV